MTEFRPTLPPPPPPMPPSQTPGAQAWQMAGQPPAGYVNYGQAPAQLPEPKGVRIATLVGFGGVTAFCAVLGVVAYRRGDLLSDYIRGNATLQQLKDSDHTVAALAVLLLVLQLAAAAVLAVWAHHTVKNAKTRSPRLDVRPGLAAGSWFIPFANYGLPWNILRRASTGSGVTARPAGLGLWQACFIGQAVLSLVARSSGNVNDATSLTDGVDRLHRQGLLFLGSAGLFLIATVTASVAMRNIDKATSGTPA